MSNSGVKADLFNEMITLLENLEFCQYDLFKAKLEAFYKFLDENSGDLRVNSFYMRYNFDIKIMLAQLATIGIEYQNAKSYAELFAKDSDKTILPITNKKNKLILEQQEHIHKMLEALQDYRATSIKLNFVNNKPTLTIKPTAVRPTAHPQDASENLMKAIKRLNLS